MGTILLGSTHFLDSINVISFMKFEQLSKTLMNMY